MTDPNHKECLSVVGWLWLAADKQWTGCCCWHGTRPQHVRQGMCEPLLGMRPKQQQLHNTPTRAPEDKAGWLTPLQ